MRSALIDDQIFYQAAPSRMHQRILSKLHQRKANYIDTKGGLCEVYPAPFAVKLHKDRKTTIVEPDISVICDRDKLTDKGCTGAPDWIIEIVSPGNSSHDYIRKLNLYADSGDREYWIVNPMEQTTLCICFFSEMPQPVIARTAANGCSGFISLWILRNSFGRWVMRRPFR